MLRSVDQVCQFQISVGVDREAVEQFQVNQVDSDAIDIVKDEHLNHLGLMAMGDRLKLTAYCHSVSQDKEGSRIPSTSTASEDDVEIPSRLKERRQRLLPMLRRDRAALRRVPSTNGRHNAPAGRPKKTTRSISVGMRIGTETERDKEGCRTSRNIKAPVGDTNWISMEIPITADYDSMLNDVQNIMFNGGINRIIGFQSEYSFELVNGKNENLRDAVSEIFSLKIYIDEKHITGAIRFYLLCCPTTLSEENGNSEILFRRPRESGGTSCSFIPPSFSRMHNSQRTYADLICYTDSEEENEAAIKDSLADVVPAGSNESISDLINEIMMKVDKNQDPVFVNVVRGKLLDGAARAITRRSFIPERPLSIKFMDDLGQADEGGPKREFFTLALQELHDGNMFLGPVRNKVVVPNQGAMQKDLYYVAGVIMALSLAHGCGGPRFLSTRMYEWISMGYTFVRSRIQLEDVPVETEIFSQLNRLQSSETLEDAHDALSELSSFLECAGCAIPLTDLKDKEKIVLSCVQFQVLDRSRSCMERILDGLSILGVVDSIRRNPEAFKPLFCGTTEKLDLLTMRTLFAPDLSPVGHNCRQYELTSVAFWNDYLVDISEGDAQLQFGDIVMFTTGIDTVPPCGFKPSLNIEFLPFSPEYKYPTANTCCCILRLPVVHQDYEKFKETIEFAVLNAIGFAQA